MAPEPPAVNLRPLDHPHNGLLEKSNLPFVEYPFISLNNSGKSKSQGVMNSELSRREEERNNKNISSESIMCNQDYNLEANYSSQFKLHHNKYSRNTNDPIERNEGGDSGNFANNGREGYKKDNCGQVNKEKNIDEETLREESVEASLTSNLPHNKALVHEQDTFEVESSTNSSFSFNPKDADAQGHGHHQTFKKQAREANQAGNCTNYNSNLNYSNNVNNGHDHENSMGKSLVGIVYKSRGRASSQGKGKMVESDKKQWEQYENIEASNKEQNHQEYQQYNNRQDLYHREFPMISSNFERRSTNVQNANGNVPNLNTSSSNNNKNRKEKEGDKKNKNKNSNKAKEQEDRLSKGKDNREQQQQQGKDNNSRGKQNSKKRHGKLKKGKTQDKRNMQLQPLCGKLLEDHNAQEEDRGSKDQRVVEATNKKIKEYTANSSNIMNFKNQQAIDNAIANCNGKIWLFGMGMLTVWLKIRMSSKLPEISATMSFKNNSP
ncbi:probable serine/threonine-protein kinase clkA [Solanum pennellii]|uniref:Probable serine/threonine-protein kinase clkA n=1 Tax=Solanum pennellii TaxID=28526 RepID=A0ABM1UZE0_SOLPN|nr:probable serine/threonine-protein kinase clkA [Solanum pennellii]